MELDSLLNAFSSAAVSTDQNSTAREHPHFSLYKSKESKASQSERRRKFLEAQKLKRFDFVNHARQLATEDFDKSESVKEDGDECEEMEYSCVPVKSKRPQKDQLMLSEWMVEVPDDLATDWLLVLCPVAKRSLVIASKGRTKVYSRSGYLMNTFQSLLPGGNSDDHSGYTILDCLYSNLHKTYFVLDMICWNSHPLYDSETEFRFYWNATKFEECPKVTEISENNPFKFIPLPYYDCDDTTLKKVLWSPLTFPDGVKLDGLLFFHKRAHYIPKQTPLAVWLKGFMVPEIMNIPVPPSFLEDQPIDYTTMKEHVPKAFEKFEKRKERAEGQMDCNSSES